MLTGAITSFPKYDESRRIIGSRIVTPEMIDQKINIRIRCCLKMMSNKIGREMIATNGHPSSTEIAVKKIDSLYCWCHQAAIAAIVKYIEKLLGKSAADEMNIPALNSCKASHERPM